MPTAAAGRAAHDGAEAFGRLGAEGPATAMSSAARRYAKAIFELAQQDHDLDAWGGRLAELRELFSDDQVVAALSNPTIATEDRQNVIESARGLDRETANLAKLLVESGRIREAAGIEAEFRRLADEAAGRVQATVTTAIELSNADRDRIASGLSRRLDREVTLMAAVDPRIIGGLRIQYGDRVVDATVATRLQQLRRRLASVT